MRAQCVLLFLLLLTLTTARRYRVCRPLTRHQLRAIVLGRACSAHPGYTLSWTICARARRMRTKFGHAVHGISARALPALLRTRAPHEAALVLFYGRYCRFSVQLMPIFGMIASTAPICALAVETVQLPALGATFGVHGLPTLLRLQRGRADVRYAGDRSAFDVVMWAENATYSIMDTVPRLAMDHHPRVEDSFEWRPDWALVISVSVCAAAILIHITEPRRGGVARDPPDAFQ